MLCCSSQGQSSEKPFLWIRSLHCEHSCQDVHSFPFFFSHRCYLAVTAASYGMLKGSFFAPSFMSPCWNVAAVFFGVWIIAAMPGGHRVLSISVQPWLISTLVWMWFSYREAASTCMEWWHVCIKCPPCGQKDHIMRSHYIKRDQSGCSCEDSVARQPGNCNLTHLRRGGTHVW